PRDVVSQSIVKQMQKTSHPSVYLDLSHLDGDEMLHRFPGIAKACRKFGLDITTDRIPVRPGAHYMLGGVTVDRQGRTSLPGLWAAGEVTSSGLHGANRLASNSLLEGLVYGAAAGEGASRAASEEGRDMRALPIRQSTSAPNDSFDIDDVRVSLKSLMGRLAGVQRDAEGLQKAADSIRSYSAYIMDHQFNSVSGWELQNLLTSAGVMVAAALARTESRGVHFRDDYPERDDEGWRRHLTVQVDVDGGYPQRTELIDKHMVA
ncbi:MAG: FAD-binding protein, partial [Planctomycetota bacterium]